MATKYLVLNANKLRLTLDDIEELFFEYKCIDIRLIKKKKKQYVVITFENEIESQIAFKQLQLSLFKGTKLYFTFGDFQEMNLVLDIINSYNDKLNISYFNKLFSSYWENIDDQLIIGIYGPSGSGKTTLIKGLDAFLRFHFNFSNNDISMIHSDSHFATKHCYFDKELKTRNMECKMACDYDAILNKINKTNSKILLMEGLMLMNDERILNKCHILIEFTCDNNICFQRRRDRRNRNNIKAFTKYYNRYVFTEYKNNFNWFWNHTVSKLINHRIFMSIDTTNYSSYQIIYWVLQTLFDCICMKQQISNTSANKTCTFV